VASSLRDKNRTPSCIDEFSESVTLELMSKSRAATQHGLIPLEVIERRIYFRASNNRRAGTGIHFQFTQRIENSANNM